MKTIQPTKSIVPQCLPGGQTGLGACLAGRSPLSLRPQCLFTFFVFCLLSFSSCDKESPPSHITEAIPFTLTGVDSLEYRLSDYRGKVVLLNFWADWCPHCRKEFAKMQQAYTELKGRGLEILAVNVGQSREHILELKQEYGLTFPLLLDEKKEIAGKYGVTGLPVSFFINRKGVIREKLIGWLKEEQIQSIFEKIRSEN